VVKEVFIVENYLRKLKYFPFLANTVHCGKHREVSKKFRYIQYKLEYE
jgi:hypothetical protein